jgi:hypothetical protein
VASPIALYITVTVARRAWASGHRALTVSGLALAVALLAGAALGLYSVPEVRAVVGFGGWASSTNALVAVVLGVTDATTLFQVGPNLLVVAGLAAGTVWAVRRRTRRWVVGAFAAVLALYVGAVAKVKILEPVTGLFYSDRTRIGPLLAVVGIPLVLWGLDWAAGAWRGRGEAGPGRARAWIAAVAAIGLVSALALTVVRPFRLHAAHYDLDAAGTTAERRFFDRAEFALIERLAGRLDPDAAVLGDPANGSGFLYSVIGQPVVFPHLTGSWDAPRRYLKEHFADLGEDPEVCAALEELGVRYVYLDDRTFRGNDDFATMTRGLAVRGNLELVDRGGTAAFYRITACD